MSTLSSPRVRTTLDALFLAAERTDAPLRSELAALPEAERAAFFATLHADPTRFYETHGRDLYLPVSRATGSLLYALARARRARRILELGTSFGLSTIHLAAALADELAARPTSSPTARLTPRGAAEADAILVATELVPSKAAAARENLARAGLEHLVELRVGDVRATLAADLPIDFDLVLFDAAKPLYRPLLESLLECVKATGRPRLAEGAVLVADNADDAPDYLEVVRDPARGFVSVPFATDVELSVFVGAP